MEFDKGDSPLKKELYRYLKKILIIKSRKKRFSQESKEIRQLLEPWQGAYCTPFDIYSWPSASVNRKKELSTLSELNMAQNFSIIIP